MPARRWGRTSLPAIHPHVRLLREPEPLAVIRLRRLVDEIRPRRIQLLLGEVPLQRIWNVPARRRRHGQHRMQLHRLLHRVCHLIELEGDVGDDTCMLVSQGLEEEVERGNRPSSPKAALAALS